MRSRWVSLPPFSPHFVATAILWLCYRCRYRKLLTTMINRVAGIDHVIFSIVSRGISRMSRQLRQLQFSFPPSLSFSLCPSFDDFVFFYFSLPLLSRSFSFFPPRCHFRSPYFPPGRIGFVSSPCDFNCQFTPAYQFFSPRPPSRPRPRRWIPPIRKMKMHFARFIYAISADLSGATSVFRRWPRIRFFADRAALFVRCRYRGSPVYSLSLSLSLCLDLHRFTKLFCRNFLR